MRVKLFLMRHAKSCSNFVREIGDSTHHKNVSQSIRDPGLTAAGIQVSKTYGPIVRDNLLAFGIDTASAFHGSSGLLRAKETMRYVFGVEPDTTFKHFKEHGNVPENTPSKETHTDPDWEAFLGDLAKQLHEQEKSTAIIVGHGSFLANTVWPAIVGKRAYPRISGRLKNLDGIFIDGDLSNSGKLTVDSVRPILCSCNTINNKFDQCSIGPQNTFIRDQLNKSKKSKKSKKNRKQKGGFSPSIMGGFGAVGVRMLLPSALYFGYRNFTRKIK